MRRLALACLLVAGLGACGSTAPAVAEDASPPPAALGPAIVAGTAIEAGTGRPLAGVRIEGPGGLSTETDANGRFVLRGLPVGWSGTLRATTEPGLRGQNRLRPLASGTLEVVIYLR